MRWHSLFGSVMGIDQQSQTYNIAEKILKPCVKTIITGMIGVEHEVGQLYPSFRCYNIKAQYELVELLGTWTHKTLEKFCARIFYSFHKCCWFSHHTHLCMIYWNIEWWLKKICLFAKLYLAEQQVTKIVKTFSEKLS